MIGIITPGNKKYTPYIENYLSILDAQKADYKVMSWDKRNLSEDGVDMRFDYSIKDANRLGMFFGYIRFIHKCKAFVKKNNIDKLIVLTAAPAFFLGERYLKKFEQNFILDIRDDSPFIRRFPKTFINICALANNVIVSSNEFSPWTGRDTILCHNVDLEQLNLHIDDELVIGHQSPVRIVFAGVMIEGNCNLNILSKFKNDNRFSHLYIGRESNGKKLIMDYVESEDISNVKFEGAYNKDEIINIYRNKADLINIFRDKTTVNRNALPNKLYEAVLAGKPLVVFEHNVAISNYAKEFNLGIVIPDGQLLINDYVYDRIQNFDYKEYVSGRKKFLNEVVNDMNEFETVVYKFANFAGNVKL